MKDILGEEAADRYEFGDLTKNAVSSFTGKEDYEVRCFCLNMFE